MKPNTIQRCCEVLRFLTTLRRAKAFFLMSDLIVGALRILWFHVPFNRINDFYRVLQQAKEAAGQGHQTLAEEKWILAGFALVSVFLLC